MLNRSSLLRLKGVDQRLIDVLKAAAQTTQIPFQVTEGLRTKERQQYLVKTGKSRTMNSYHLKGKAVDLVAMPGGEVSWNLADYKKIDASMQKAAKKLGVKITWGGTWKSIVDGPHWQIED